MIIKNKLLLLSLIIVSFKSIIASDDLGLIFFTNFEYFKSNERNFQTSNFLYSPILNPDNPDEIPTPDEPNIPIIPSIPELPKPEIPEIIPGKPDVEEPEPNIPEVTPPPVVEDKYSKIFYNNEWIYNTHSYITPNDIDVISNDIGNSGMGSVETNFSIENAHNINITNSTDSEIYFGMLSLNGGSIINGLKGNINLNGNGYNFGLGIFGEGNARNLGTISGDAKTGIYLNGKGYAQNFGTIDINNGIAAVISDNNGQIFNYGTINITNTKFGMLSLNGGTIVNEVIDGYTNNILSDNKEFAKMAVIGSGSGINHGDLTSNNVPYIMYSSGDSSLYNYGTLTANINDDFSNYTILFGENGGTIINEESGILNLIGGYDDVAMILLNSGSATNYGTINLDIYEHGMLITNDAIGRNYGEINFGTSGVGAILLDSTEDSYFINYGTIKDGYNNKISGSYAIYGTGSGMIENRGLISLNSGSAGIYFSGNGSAINEKDGIIDITHTRYGMQATNGASIYNYGQISITPIDDLYFSSNGGMFVTGAGTAINYGDIIFGGYHTNGMSTNGSGYLENGEGGTITILDGSKDSYAFNLNKGTAVNRGIIDLGNNGYTVNNGTLFNYGKIIAPNGIKTGSSGKLVMEKGGTTNTQLETATLGLSYTTDLYTENDTDLIDIVLPFDTNNLTSYSHLYDVTLNDNTATIRRKEFSEISDDETSKYLNSIYFDSDNDIKNKFFNILKSANNSEEYNSFLNKLLGKDIYPATIFQTKNAISYTTNDILQNTSNKLPSNRKSSYIIGYSFDKLKQSGFSSVMGYEENLNSFFLGKQYNLNTINDYGFVFSYTRLNSDYNSSSGKREDNMFQGTAFINYNKDYLSAVTSFYLGYSKGEIKRSLNLNYLDYNNDSPIYSDINENFKADTKNFYLGTAAKASKYINFNLFFVEPEIKGYAMGIFQNKINETGGDFELEINDVNRFFGKVNFDLGIGKSFDFNNTYALTLKLIGGIGQEINSSSGNIKASLKNISDENANIYIGKRNLFSKEIGTRIDLQRNSSDSLSFYTEYKYIFEKDNSWKITTGLNYKF